MRNYKNNEPETVLIVDDEADLREVLVEILEGVAPRILMACNGDAALRIMENQRVDAVVTDITMPVMNGLELLAEVRRRGIQTPFALVTGYAEKAFIIDALRLGAKDFVEKPFASLAVVTLVSNMLRTNQARLATEAAAEKKLAS